MRKKPRPTLCIASTPREAWEGAIRDWFEATLPAVWKQPLPSLVVLPTRSYVHALKERLLRGGRSHLGLRFVTPRALRELLAHGLERSTPSPEHLRLLLAIAAEEVLASETEDKLAARAVLRTPDHLLRMLDRLEAAGWDFTRLQMRSFEPIVQRFRQHLDACGFNLTAQTDRIALRRATESPPKFASLLITGFDAAHWRYWFLLRAAVAAAEQATVVLENPREPTNFDTCWIGSWEEALGEAMPISAASENASDSLFSEAEMRGLTPRVDFLVGADAAEQAEAVALQCLQFLAAEKCTRLGIIFARAEGLARLVASALIQAGIPHNDGLGHPVPGLFESEEWRAWIALQRSPRIASFLRFTRAPQLERPLRDAHAEILIDDLDVLREFCAAQTGEPNQLVAQTLASFHFLPERATLTEFLEATQSALAQLGWTQHWSEIAHRTGAWVAKIGAKIPRSLYLRWLEEIASTFGAARAPEGDHPYARVQLLTVAQACGQEWSHIIFAGWNEGSWPPPAGGDFMREEEIDAFNQSVQQLNRRAQRQGRQGEGHTSVRENHALYPGPAEQRQIALRQFDALLESAGEGVAFTASLVQESAPERLWNPSELLTRLYRQASRGPLTQRAMKRLQVATERWLEESRTPKVKATALEQTRLAYLARRDAVSESNEFDFALSSPPRSVPTLSVSEFEKLLSAPALVWMKKYLGVKAAENDANIWNTSTGKWIHDWLASIADGTEQTFAPLPDAPEIDRRILSLAEQKRAHVTALCQAARKPLPDWWKSGWQNALFLARTLGEKLATADGWPWMATEWTVDDARGVEVADGARLFFRGRIDLLLARQPIGTETLAAEELWIVDYKTGAKKALVAGREDAEKRKPALRKKLLDGSALQLALYAFAARALGAGHIWVSLLSPLVRPLTPQLAGADIASEADIFQELARMQRTGIFGRHGPLRSAYRFGDDYPLATLPIDPDILEQRWERTHPALVREEEDIFW